MLICCTKYGLVNGAIGQVVDIWFQKAEDPKKRRLPVVVFL